MSLDLGTLTVKLAADVESLKKDLAKATSEVRNTNATLNKLGEAAFGAFKGIGGSANAAAEKVNRLREAARNIFGDQATAQGQRWGQEISRAIGLSQDQIKGLEQGSRGLAGGIQAAAVAASLLNAPLLAAVAAMAGLVLGAGAFKIAWDAGMKDSIPAVKGFTDYVLSATRDVWTDIVIGWVHVSVTIRNALIDAVDAAMGVWSSASSKMGGIFGPQIGAARSSLKSEKVSGSEEAEVLKSTLTDFYRLANAGSDYAKRAIDSIKSVGTSAASAAASGIKQSWDAFGGKLLGSLDLKSLIPKAGTSAADVEKRRALDEEEHRERMKDLADLAKYRIEMLDEALKREKQSEDVFERGLAKALIGRQNSPNRISKLTMSGGADQGQGGVSDFKEVEKFALAQYRDGVYKAVDFAMDQRLTAEQDAAIRYRVKLQSAIDYATQSFSDSVIQGSGALGKVIQGAQAGGWIGAIIALLTSAKQFSDLLSKAADLVQGVADGVGEIFEGFGYLLDAIKPILDTILTVLKPLFNGLKDLLWEVGQWFVLIGKLFEGFAPILETAFSMIGAALSTVADVLEVLWPILKPIIQAILMLVKIISEIGNAFTRAVIWVIKGFIDSFGFLGKDFVNKAKGWVDRTFGAMLVDTGKIQTAIDSMDTLTHKENEQSDALDKTNKGLNEFAEALTNIPTGYLVQRARLNSIDVPAMASGGIVTSPTLALIGEAGPEMVTPLSGSGAKSGANIVINISGAGDPDKVAREVMKRLQRENFLTSGSLIQAAPAFSGSR